MAGGLSFDEIVPDGQASDYEPLVAGRVRPPPPWLVWLRSRWSQTRYVALSVLACFLAAGSVPATHVSGALNSMAGGWARPGPGAAHSYLSGGRCPTGVMCTVTERARQDMWDAYNRLFTGTWATTVGAVWYAAETGVVYFQELDAAAPGAVAISLTEQRIDTSPPISFGPTVDLTPSVQHGGWPSGGRAAFVTAQRGAWLVTASLTGPHGSLLPIDAAVHWAGVAPLPD